MLSGTLPSSSSASTAATSSGAHGCAVAELADCSSRAGANISMPNKIIASTVLVLLFTLVNTLLLFIFQIAEMRVLFAIFKKCEGRTMLKIQSFYHIHISAYILS